MINHYSTYRIQFNHLFPFKELEKYVEYLAILGVDTVYASPIFKSTPGSKHGYDVVNPSTIDPELGGLKDFEELLNVLRNEKIHWLQDVVPNHMAFNGHNVWLWDVLEKGQDSEYARIFDIDWDHPDFNGRIMVPFLGKSFDEVVHDYDLQLIYENGNFHFKYYDDRYPINVQGFLSICRINKEERPEIIDKLLNKKNQKENAVHLWKILPPWDYIKEEIEGLYKTSVSVKNWIDDLITHINANPDRLKGIHDLQFYQLCHWKLTEKKINYRRFFTVNSLICLRMEDPGVYDFYHDYLKELLKKYNILGLRVDHVDGLRDPGGYLNHLRMMTDLDIYLCVEKILELEEEIPAGWKIQGATGYEFLAWVNNLLTNEDDYPVLAGFYPELTGIKQELSEIIHEKKKLILMERMHGELDNLCRMFFSLDQVKAIRLPILDRKKMGKALAEFLIGFPVYRLYVTSIPPDEENAVIIKQVIADAISSDHSLEKELNFLGDLLLDKNGENHRDLDQLFQFFSRCMQFTGPLMAKGVEDTTMYYFNRFIAHNEVGDHPGSKGVSIKRFHETMRKRQRRWPLAMNSTSTHDTKRGEDVRARLNVLSDLTPEWTTRIISWVEMNAGYKQKINGIMVPTVNEEYLIYQTLTGIWPMDSSVDDDFKDRLIKYFTKAMREAKTHSAWNEPEESHEKAVFDFLFNILNSESLFYQSFVKFQDKTRQYGYVNSLVQLVLKITCPGIPDLYQGTELWDLTLVDPDNRRPVDYDIRKTRLKQLIKRGNEDRIKLWKKISVKPYSGDLKLWLTHLLLRERKLNPGLFSGGEYIPFEIKGKFRNHAISFGRKFDTKWILVVLPLHLATIQDYFILGKESIDWQDTTVCLSETISGKCYDIVSLKIYTIGSRIRPCNFHNSDPLLILRSLPI